MDFEPIGAASVTGAALRHAHQEAFAKSAGLARRPVLLVDDALAAVLAFGYHRQVVVRSSEKRLQQIQIIKGKLGENQFQCKRQFRLKIEFQHGQTTTNFLCVTDWPAAIFVYSFRPITS